MALAVRTTTARRRADRHGFIGGVGEGASVFLPIQNAKWVEVCLYIGRVNEGMRERCRGAARFARRRMPLGGGFYVRAEALTRKDGKCARAALTGGIAHATDRRCEARNVNGGAAENILRGLWNW